MNITAPRYVMSPQLHKGTLKYIKIVNKVISNHSASPAVRSELSFFCGIVILRNIKKIFTSEKQIYRLESFRPHKQILQ